MAFGSDLATPAGVEADVGHLGLALKGLCKVVMQTAIQFSSGRRLMMCIAGLINCMGF